MIDAVSILKIDVPEKLFSAPDKVEAEYKIFAKKFHPDLSSDKKQAEEAFKQLNFLHVLAKNKIKIGEWQIPNQLDFVAIDGKPYRIRYIKEFDAGICKGYVGREIVAYVFAKDVKDLVENATKIIGKFKFPKEEPNIQKNIEPNLPKIKKVIETKDKIIMVFEKCSNMIRLKDVFEHLDKKIDPKHAAWILSRCYNFACYLEWLGYGHHEFSMDSVFINPETHEMSLIGGWWYASPINERMKRLQSTRTVKYAPQKVLSSKMTNISTDLELIRLLGRELLGDGTGLHLSKNKDNPIQLVNWLRLITTGKAKKDFSDWHENLKKVFGERKFTVFNLKADDVYHLPK
jgi:hypothetical protein